MAINKSHSQRLGAYLNQQPMPQNNNTQEKQVEAYLNSLLIKYNLNLPLIKKNGYSIASFECNQIFDNMAEKLALALQQQGIERLYIYEYEGAGKNGYQGNSIPATQEAIEEFQNWEIFPESFFGCFLFDKEFRVIITRPPTSDTSYFCGNEAFVSYLTNLEICKDFIRV
jgi:hypothetical protein